MRFGLCYIADHHPAQQGSFSDWYEGMIAEVQTAERAGFHGAWVAEHHFPDFAFGNPAVFLTALARETSTIRIGSSVSLAPLGDPIRMAEDYAMLDVLSRGRLDYGVGRGAYRYDYDACRVDMSESRERFFENLDIMEKAWTGRPFTHHGRWTTIEDHRVSPVPMQDPLPVWIGATISKETFQWAGAHDYNLACVPFMYADPGDLRERLSIYREALEENGHDPAGREVLGVYHMYCAPDREEMVATVGPAMDRFREFGKAVEAARPRDPVAYREWTEFNKGEGFAKSREQWNLAEIEQNRSIFGTPQECIDRIGQIHEQYGIDYLIFEVNFGGLAHERVVESLLRFGAEVMPHLASQGPTWGGVLRGGELT